MHYISGLIAQSALLTRIAASLDLLSPTTLPEDLAFLPIDTRDIIRLAGESRPVLIGDDYQALDAAFFPMVQSLSVDGRIAYVQTEYFGGGGGQAALVADQGEILFGPTHDKTSGPINDALRLLGVQGGDDIDPFQAIGLASHRSNDGWRKAAGGKA
ncbi:hypothetical protein [Sphingomonas sp.]|uniref:hypothetical protein n=1 Tax=Sphingomonas sp. TaxID=28214 RepID=UPI003D6D2102